MDSSDETLDLLGYLRRLKRHLVPALVVGVVVAALLTLLGMRSAAAATHAGKAHVLVTPAASTNSGEADLQAQLLPQVMRTYVALEDSDPFVNEVVSETKGRFTADQVKEQTTIYWGGGSLLLAIQTTASSDQDAIDLANAGANALVKEQAAMLGNAKDLPTLTVAQKGFVDTTASTAAGSKLSGLKSGIVAGVAAALVVAFVLELIGSRRKRTR